MNVITIFVFINLFVAILIENFYLAQNNGNLEREDPELFSYLKFCFTNYIIVLIKINNKSEIKNKIKIAEEQLKPTYVNSIDLHQMDKLVIRWKKVLRIFHLDPGPDGKFSLKMTKCFYLKIKKMRIR